MTASSRFRDSFIARARSGPGSDLPDFLALVNAQPWMARGACVDHPKPEQWFNTRGGRETKLAQSICRHCPVMKQCREFALKRCLEEEEAVPGIWGGTTPQDRHDILKQRRKGTVRADRD